MSSLDDIRLVIIEDHELSRYGLNMSFSDRSGLKVVGEAENGQKGVDLVLKEKPDIVLMDIGMPIMNGIEATRLIKAKNPEIKVVILTSLSNSEEVIASMAAGADAYCIKEIKLDRLQQVLEMVMEGAIWLDPAIAKVVMNTLLLQENPDETVPLAYTKTKQRYNAELTEREMEVLKYVVEGKSNKEIAVLMSVSQHTSKAHVASILQKLAVDSRTQVAVKALQEGLIERI
jgi:two-component system, NarL family, response regulator LiaR